MSFLFRFVLSRASAEAERDLCGLSCVCVYVDQNKATPPPLLLLKEILMTTRFDIDQ